MKFLSKSSNYFFFLVAIICLVLLVYIIAIKQTILGNYFLIFFLLLLFLTSLVITRTFKSEIKNIIALTALSGISAVYVAELYLTFENLDATRIEFSTTHDHRTMREVVDDLRKSGQSTAVPIIYPSYLITRPDLFSNKVSFDSGAMLPLAGISSRTTALCNESGYWAIYDSDEFGFRNPKGIWGKSIDIAVVGDSFSHGNCVKDGNEWVSVVRKKHPMTINLGMGGNGPLYALATIKEYLTSVKPKIVIWEYYEANETRIKAEYAITALKRYLDEPDYKQNIMLKQADVDVFLEQIVNQAAAPPKEQALHSKIASFLFLKHLRPRLGLHSVANARTNPNILILRKALAEGKRAVESWGGVLYFVYLPSALGLTSPVSPDWYATREEVISLAKSEGLQIIDLYPVFKAYQDPLQFFPYRAPLHYNEEGYKVVGDTIMKSLR
jgi:hypothetical protein